MANAINEDNSKKKRSARKAQTTRLEETKTKVQRVRELLFRTGLGGILLKSQANFSWITCGGLNVVTIADIQGIASILITAESAYFVTNNIELPRMQDEEGLGELGFEPVVFEWFSGHEYDVVARIVPPKQVGCDCQVSDYRYLEKEIRELRYALLPPEIDRYLWLGERASLALEKVLSEFVQPGMKESEVVGELSKTLWKDRIDSVCYQAAADERAFRYRHAIPTERSIERYVMVNVNARKWGLITTVTRAAYFGKIDPGLAKQYVDNTYIECGMIAFSRPGTLVRDIFARTCKLYESLGYAGEWKNHHQGGAQGYCNRDYLMKADSEEQVLENQCFCWNPSIRGTKSEDAIIAQKGGHLFITKPMIFPTVKIDLEGLTFIRPALLVR
jgi:Xaa-Pro dipeptidase